MVFSSHTRRQCYETPKEARLELQPFPRQQTHKVVPFQIHTYFRSNWPLRVDRFANSWSCSLCDFANAFMWTWCILIVLLCDPVWTCHTLLVCSLPKFNLKKVQEYFKNFQRQSKYHDTLLLWFWGDYVAQGFIQSKLSWSLLFFVPYSSFGQLHVREQRLLTKKHGMWGLCLPTLYITTRWNLPWWWHYVTLRDWKMFSDSVTNMDVILSS